MAIWDVKLARLSAEIAAKTAERNGLLTLIGAGSDAVWEARAARILEDITVKTAERDALAVLVGAEQDPELAAQVAALTTERDALVVERDALTASLSTANSTIATHVATIAARDVTIAGHVSTIELRDDAIVELNATIVNLEAQIAALLAQLPDAGFLTFDEMRAGDVSAHGYDDLLVVYESAMFPGSVTQQQRATTPPDTTFLNTYFSGLKAANPTVNRVVLDLEAWVLIASGAVNTTAMGWYITLVQSAQAHFSDVGLYGELTERYTLYLNYPPGHATHISRKNSWFARAAAMQPLWDAVNTIYPSFYYIAPVATDAADRDLWYVDNAQMVAQFAPGKKVIPFLWPRVHQSVDPTMPFIDGEIFRGTLDKMWELFDGYALWLESSDPDLSTLDPEPLWWTRAKEFQIEKGLV